MTRDEHLKQLIADKKNLIKTYTVSLNEIVQKHLSDKYIVSCLTESILYIAVNLGSDKTYPWGESIEIYHGYDIDYDTLHKQIVKKWRFETNVAAMGSFNLLANSSKLEYYKLVGIIVSNDKLKNALNKKLLDFAENVKVINDKISDIHEEIRKEKNAKLQAEFDAKRLKELDAYKKFAQNCPNGFVLYENVYTGTTNYMYRKKYINIVSYSIDKEKIQNKKWHSGLKIAVANKIKIA